VVQLISCLSVKRAASAKSSDVVPFIETVKGGALAAQWWRDNEDITMAKIQGRSVMRGYVGERKPIYEQSAPL
jgi:uncharacterized protein (DUF697 family)